MNEMVWSLFVNFYLHVNTLYFGFFPFDVHATFYFTHHRCTFCSTPLPPPPLPLSVHTIFWFLSLSGSCRLFSRPPSSDIRILIILFHVISIVAFFFLVAFLGRGTSGQSGRSLGRITIAASTFC